jgi:transcription-repair coupling factor (superfamily II helicase)
VDIKLPQSYLPDAGDRLALYKRLAQATRPADVDRLQAETEDRFGHLPRAAQNLFEMGRLRVLAEEIGVRSIDLVEDRLHVRFHDMPSVEPARLIGMLNASGGTLTPAGLVLLPVPQRGGGRIQCAVDLLRRIIGES